MSSLSPKADMLPVSHHVRFGPIGDIAPLIRSPHQPEARNMQVCHHGLFQQ